MLLEENDQVMIEYPRTEDWFVWGMHSTESPYAPGGTHLVVELPAVKDMINMVAQGYVSGPELHEALDAFAERFGPQDARSARPDPRNVYVEEESGGYDCPHGCPVCAGARAEFDAIAAESYTHKVRLSDPDRHPYAAGKSTLHRSSCPRVARFVGRAEPVGSPRCLAGLPAFAHHGVCSTTWASGMQVMTAQEAVEWVRWQADPRDGAGYKLCCQCLPPDPGSVAEEDTAYGASYWAVDSAVTWR